MKVENLIVVLILCFFSKFDVCAQTKSENIISTSKVDSLETEMMVLKAANWLENSDLDKEQENRKKINGIVLKWYIDNIGLNISLAEKLKTINGENGGNLMMIYFAGFSKYYIEHKTDKPKFEAQKAGLVSVMKVYKKGVEITNSPELDRLINLTEQGKLDEYVKDNFE